MKKLSSFALTSLFSALVMVAVLSFKPACAWIWYQPKLPEKLTR